MKRLRKITVAVLALGLLFSLFGGMYAFAAAQGGSGDIDVPFDPVKRVRRIWIATKPAKREYKVGEMLELTGMVVKAAYSDGSTIVVNNNKCSVEGYSANTPGVQTITVTYSGKDATFEVTVYKPGSANGNDTVDDDDVNLLQRHVAGQGVQIDDRSADVNGDGAVDGKDAILLQRYLAGWNVNIG